MFNKMVTIGVYGTNEDRFYDAIRKAGVDDADIVAALNDGHAFLRRDLGRRAHRVGPCRHAQAGDRHKYCRRKGRNRSDRGHPANAAFARGETDCCINEEGEDQPKTGIDRPIADRRSRFGAKQATNEHGDEVKGPEADDRLGGQSPVGKPAVGGER